MRYFDEINNGHRFFVTHIAEPEENCLQLEITVPGIGEETDMVVSDGHVLTCREVTYDTYSPKYRMVFKNYIAYAIIKESYDNGDANIATKGRYFRICENSSFQDYVTKDTFVTVDYPGPFMHYQLLGQCHIINVASTEDPIIERL